jgi:hypothetical protein
VKRSVADIEAALLADSDTEWDVDRLMSNVSAGVRQRRRRNVALTAVAAAVLTVGATLPVLLLHDSGGTVPIGTTSGPTGPTTAPAPTTSSTPVSRFAADEVVLQFASVGGQTLPINAATGLPNMTFYGDGRIIQPNVNETGPQAPTLQIPWVSTISQHDLEKVVALAKGAGLGEDVDYGIPTNLAIPNSRITFNDGSGQRVILIDAMSYDAEPGLTQAQLQARQKVKDLTMQLANLSYFGIEKSRSEPYPMTALAVIAEPWSQLPDSYPHPAEKTWPGPAIPDPGPDAKNLSCVTISGDELSAVSQALQGAIVYTPWLVGGQKWFIRARPLLPHEHSCADLDW